MSNVNVKVSWAAVAITIGGAEPVLVDGSGHEGDAVPDDVQLRVAGVGDICAVVPPAPHALRSAKARRTTGATT